MKMIDINNPPPLNACSQQVTNQNATTQVEECLKQSDELENELVTVEESQEPDDEDVVNTLTDELETKIEFIDNSSNFDENCVGDLPMLLSNLANALSMEVTTDIFLTNKTCVFDQQ